MKPLHLITIILSLVISCEATAFSRDPLYENSIVATDFDFIRDHDPSILESIQFVGVSLEEMPDRRNDDLFSTAYIFNTTYSDGTSVQIRAHEDFGTQRAAKVYVGILASTIGQQPRFNRVKLKYVVLHKGDEVAYSEDAGQFFVIYSENMDTRIRHDDLQETVFHECAHVAFEAVHATAPGWMAAQQADAGFITDYARANPIKEDVPESAIFAYVILNHPGRLNATVEISVRNQIPNRIAYFAQLDGFIAVESDASPDAMKTSG